MKNYTSIQLAYHKTLKAEIDSHNACMKYGKKWRNVRKDVVPLEENFVRIWKKYEKNQVTEKDFIKISKKLAKLKDEEQKSNNFLLKKIKPFCNKLDKVQRQYEIIRIQEIQKKK